MMLPTTAWDMISLMTDIQRHPYSALFVARAEGACSEPNHNVHKKIIDHQI